MGLGTAISKSYIFFRYLFTVFFHKFVIFTSGIYINFKLRGSGFRIPLKRLIIHDNSKFSSHEFWPYADYYYGSKTNITEFKKAWTHHFQNNDHHWEYFVEGYEHGVTTAEECKKVAREMPDEALLEMTADWFSATIAYEWKLPIVGKWRWAQTADPKIGMHLYSKVFFYGLLVALGYRIDLERWFNIENCIDDLTLPEGLRQKLIRLKRKEKENSLSSISSCLIVCFLALLTLFLYFVWKK